MIAEEVQSGAFRWQLLVRLFGLLKARIEATVDGLALNSCMFER